MSDVIVLAGPTGVGKSRIAIELALRLGGEIISADSRQVYGGLRIGTARLDEAAMRGVPHHLMGFLDPRETYSAGQFARDAANRVEQIDRRGNLPLICGGTGFYIQALLEGLFDETTATGEKDAMKEVRKSLESELERIGSEELHRRLESVDPESAGRIHPNDSQRIIRALEIFEITGKPISILHEHDVRESGIRAYKVCLNVPRETLYRRIEQRVLAMFEDGFVEEVRSLLANGYGKEIPAFESLGYLEIIRYLDGEIDLETAQREIQRATRAYAKRQMTWFRRDASYHWIEVGSTCVDRIIAEWFVFLDGGEESR